MTGKEEDVAANTTTQHQQQQLGAEDTLYLCNFR